VDHAFWHARWQEGRIGFHEGQPNSFLMAHHAWLAGCHRVLVPLCGKTEDLAFLASRGHAVVGVELVEDAVRQFFAEHGAAPEVSRQGDLAIYAAGAITIIAGDLFATPLAVVGAIDGIYDRAALVALPADLRPRYTALLRAQAPRARRELLVSLDYPEGATQGPPFSVPEAEVRALIPDATIALIDSAPDPRDRAGGQLMQHCYTIEFPIPSESPAA
jgi:thiopurine S-methyltransferase